MIKILDKYKKLPVQVKASFWFLICAFLQKGISFITTPIFTRLLSTSEYGQYNVFNSWMGILTVFVTLNLYYGGYMSGLVRYAEDKKAFTSSFQGLLLTLIAFWTVAYLLFHDFWNSIFSLTTMQMLLMILLMWSTAVFTFWSSEQRTDFKYKKLVVITLIVSIAKPIIGIIFVTKANDKVTARILGIALVELIAYTGLFFTQMRAGKKFFSKKYWKYALAFNIPLIPHYLSSSVLSGADRIMIGEMVSQSAAGIYSLAYSVSMIMTMFNTALMQTIEPWLYKKIRDKKVEDISKIAYPAFIGVAFVNLCLIAFAPEAVAIFAPTEYYDAIYIIPPVAMSVFFTFSYSFFASFEFYYKKTKLIAFATSVGAVLNIVLNYIFINIFGYYAAGYTTLVCYMVYASFHFIFMKKICNEKLDGAQPYSTKIYIAITAVFMVLGFAFLFTYNMPIIRYGLILIMIISVVVNRKKIIVALKNIMLLRQSKADSE